MNFITRFLYVALAGVLVLTSCAEDTSESYNELEKQALEAWITQNRPELVGNYQEEGGYYIDVLEAGDQSLEPINTDAIWVKFDFSGRDLAGNIVLTRNDRDAKLAGTFTKYTHYVPFYRYCGTENSGLMEGTWLAMRNKLTLGEEYFNANKDRLGLQSAELQLRYGSQVRLYMPSRVVGSGGVEGTGGYEGQYSLSTNRPFIVTMMIRDTVANPLEREGSSVDNFCKDNGGLLIYSKDGEDDTEIRPEDPEDPNHAYNASPRWVSACDTVAQLYVNVRYNPTLPGGDPMTFPEPYVSSYEPYTPGAMATIDQKIAEVLKERFHGDDSDAGEYVGVKALDADSVTLEGTAKIWYIGRFMDGFIFDTNIDEVKEIIYGEVKTTGSALSYTPSSGGMIQAFYYVVPNLKFGQWAELITTSTNAYGSSGQSGSSSSSSTGGYSSSYYDYMNYLNYANSYYGSSGYYGGYYGNYYNNYYGGYYGSSYGYDYDSSDTGSTVTTVSTEIPSFTPLIFQIYIEPED
ncbi:hypothetical protein [uncultured Alistipes sp.]|jgi:FKBP-type peptidyl-prolyl cis-trans isomerases 1|uniref:hypothetical protein n=1 Tax=uncultured Alistipes sp. TaxID=538949 RepID=UPI0026006F5C|nr:hypothetical protein [uncultured Alistipes sp.]